MSEPPDFELRREPVEPAFDDPPPKRASSVWIAVVLLVAVAGVAGYVAFVWRQTPAPAGTTTGAAKPAAAAAAAPLGGRGEPMTLPQLDASDTLVRTLVQALTESPAVMAWLPTRGLIRNFTVVVATSPKARRPPGSSRS